MITLYTTDMKKIIKYCCFIVFLFIPSSCYIETEYVYIIENISTEAFHLHIFPEGEDEIDKEYPGYNKFYEVCFIGKEGEKMSNYQPLMTIRSRNALKFATVIGGSTHVHDNPEDDDHRPLWFEHSCIRMIVLGESVDGKERVLSAEYWSNRNNWIRQNKKKHYVEYWLKIDDSVISQYATEVTNN